MKIDTIFNIENKSLYSVKYFNYDKNEFERIFDNWITDLNFLYDFFTKNKKDLQSGFYGDITIKNAIKRTIEEAEKLEETLLYAAEKGEIDFFECLQTIFKPLHNDKYKVSELLQTKAYGNRHKSWLRIYAIRINANTYIITGGAIKLTPYMNCLHLKQELTKIELVRRYLSDNNVFEQEDFEFLEIRN